MSDVYQKGASKITKLEAGKSNVKVGDVREIFRHLCEEQIEMFKAGNADGGILMQLIGIVLNSLEHNEVVMVKGKKFMLRKK
jgi:hypothetical protein